MPKRILCLDQFSTMGGAQQCLLDLVPFLNEAGCETTVVLPGKGTFADKLHAAGCELNFFTAAQLSRKQKPLWEGVPYGLAVGSAVRALSRSVREHKPDVLYVNGPRFLPAAALTAWRYDLPLLFHAHNRLLQQGALNLVGSALRGSSARVVACCEWVAESLRRYVDGSRIRVVYNGTRDLQVMKRPGPGRIETVGVIGRISPEKGQVNLVNALSLLKNWTLKCTFIGAPSAESIPYYREVLRASAGQDVSFPGWRDDIESAIAGLDLLVVPSLCHDAAPRVILEAFSAGIPVLACPSGGIPELIEDNVTGFLTTGSSPKDIADRLAEVLRTPLTYVQKVAAAARRTWIERFSLDRYREGIWKEVQSCTTV
jgi:glycosyltransferase involved in cell wall biosynthesis